MKYLAITVNVLLVINVVQCDSEKYRQEAAKVIYSNPKYIEKINILTFRKARHSPYVTSCNATIVVPFENNVSVAVKGGNAKLKTEIFNLEFKVCDILKLAWAKEWLKTYSNVPLTCPVAADLYQFKEIEMPPKNFPIPLPNGDNTFYVNFLHTKTRERILELKMNLKFENKAFG